ncbi:MAG: hypothetical protein Kow0092_00570 [Deferrisomatales bacterium]
MNAKRIPWFGALALLGGLLAGYPAGAREVVREPFEAAPAGEAVAGRDGAGWTYPDPAFEVRGAAPVSHEIALGRAGRGLIAFDLLRRPGLDVERRTVFALQDRAGENLLLFQVRWASDYDPARPMLFLWGNRYFNEGLQWWSPWVLLDREVVPGQWIHVDLVWDEPAGRYALYVDGRAQDVRPRFYDAVEGLVVPDPRQVMNRNAAARGLPPEYEPGRFSELVADARTLQLGLNWAPGGDVATSPLANAVLDNFVIAVEEPLAELHTPAHDVKELRGEYTPEGILLTWAPPEIHGIDQQYLVYRRAGERGGARFEKLTPEPVRDLRFLDRGVRPGETYRYSVTSVYADLAGGHLEGKYPPEVTVAAAERAIASVGTDRTRYGAGQRIVVTLRGTPDLRASFTVEGVAAHVPMEEVDDGVYVGSVEVPPGVSLERAPVTGELADPAGGPALTAPGPRVGIDTAAPEAIPAGRLLAEAPWAGEIELSWVESPSADVAYYAVYRGEERNPYPLAEPYEKVRATRFVDTAVVAGMEYRYAVAPVDEAGNVGPASEVVRAEAVAGDGPRISGVSVEPAGRPLKPGQTVTVTVAGQSDGEVAVDLGELARGLLLAEQGRTGRYVGTYTVGDGDVGPQKTLHRVVAHLTDAFGTSELAGPELAVVGRDTLNDTTPPTITAARHDGWKVAGFSGKLVAGDVLTVTVEGEPEGYGSFDIPGVVEAVPLAETAPGVYEGSYTVGWEDEGEDRPVVARLVDEAGNETTVSAGRPVSFDTRVRLAVTARDALLPADRRAATRLVVEATDANGDGVAGHELALTLSTTEEYTGVVGGGRLEDREARLEDADDLEVKWDGVTDDFGKVTATYTAGFAAKTALLVAKDLTTGDVGAGWLHTYVASTVAIELVPRAARGAADRATLRLTAEPAKLTADGRSTSRVRAWLADLSGRPIEGARIAFALAGDNGRLKVLDAVTDDRGVAEAAYRAGTAIGTVTVTAAAAEYGVTASVGIVLMSDAPAKIDLVAEAKKLPADGRSTAALSVRVTDVHDNPNQEVPVTFAVLRGEGSVSEREILTDRNGEGRVTFTAGHKPGLAVVEARHTSRPPTEEELRRVYGTVFVPRLHDRQERDRVKVEEWLVDPGDEVEAGQPLVTLKSGRGTWTLTAPAQGTFVRKVKFERDRVELGETLGYVELDPDVWEEIYRD